MEPLIERLPRRLCDYGRHGKKRKAEGENREGSDAMTTWLRLKREFALLAIMQLRMDPVIYAPDEPGDYQKSNQQCGEIEHDHIYSPTGIIPLKFRKSSGPGFPFV
jgi:hypothetical protein